MAGTIEIILFWAWQFSREVIKFIYTIRVPLLIKSKEKRKNKQNEAPLHPPVNVKTYDRFAAMLEETRFRAFVSKVVKEGLKCTLFSFSFLSQGTS